ncbi:hypothetical protein [Arthrobacter bambusae]|uniref:hypothetical protein n=1 Tax=Arthrobacter bambusae TaxID=1338426 RepID=UPI00278AB135|nr:hypothetical protein [Arthrobacter bambusae]MDQ0029280.1 hypothetical protein [Arthrobacter bambusae]MDQ0098189.1 hypothetical protein [Arthrobacter bambusae]
MHHFLIALATTPSPTPTPSLRPGLSEDQVTPGTWGFVLTAFIVLLTTFLIVDMVRRIRRVRYRAQVEEASAAEAGNTEAGTAEAGATPGTAVAGGVVPGKPIVEDSDGDAGSGAR